MVTSGAAFCLAGDARIEFAVVRLDVPPETVGAVAALLSAAEWRRAGRFAFLRDRRRYTVARARLRQLLGERLQVRPEEIEFVYGKCGKPALAPPFAHAALRFNLAHAGDVAVCAFSRGREIGIDVEAVRVISDAEAIAARFFSRRENEAYRALDRHDRPLGFLNWWTRKEAYVKALGYGHDHPLDSFEVTLAPDEPAQFLRIGDTPGTTCGWALHSFSPGPGLVGAIAVQQTDVPAAWPTAATPVRTKS